MSRAALTLTPFTPQQMLLFSLAPTVGKVLAKEMALEINPSTITDEKLLEANRTELESLVSFELHSNP